MKTKSGQALSVLPRLRVVVGREIAVGPGKAELLRLVQETKSISEAARRMHMSYMRAWSLIRTMNGCFREPVILTRRGGQARGGASLTQTGKQLLSLYQRLERDFRSASKVTRRKMAALLKDAPGHSLKSSATAHKSRRRS